MIIQKLNEKKKNKSEKNISSSSEMNPCKNSLILLGIREQIGNVMFFNKTYKRDLMCYIISI